MHRQPAGTFQPGDDCPCCGFVVGRYGANDYIECYTCGTLPNAYDQHELDEAYADRQRWEDERDAHTDD